MQLSSPDQPSPDRAFELQEDWCLHSIANCKQGSQSSVQSSKAGVGAKLQSRSHAAVGSRTMTTAGRAAAAAAFEAQMTSKGTKLITTGKAVGSAQHVQVSLSCTICTVCLHGNNRTNTSRSIQTLDTHNDNNERAYHVDITGFVDRVTFSSEH